MSVRGSISEFKELKDRLSNKDYSNSIERLFLISELDDIKEDVKEQMEQQYERQNRVKLMLRSIGFISSNKAIFRMETKRKIFNWYNLQGFENHMLRLTETLNADPELIKYDIVLKGHKSPVRTLKEYYQRYNLKAYGKTNNRTRMCTELVYSVSPKFFKKAGSEQWDFKLIERWATTTMRYLEAEFPDGQLVWSMLHTSEATPHLHVLVCGRTYHNKWKKEVISHSKFFGDKGKLKTLQSNYANALQRRGFLVNRGLMGSKARHKDVKRWQAEQRDKDIIINEFTDTLRKKDEEANRQINEIRKNAEIERRARNKVIRALCSKFGVNLEEVDKEIEKNKIELKKEKKIIEKI